MPTGSITRPSLENEILQLVSDHIMDLRPAFEFDENLFDAGLDSMAIIAIAPRHRGTDGCRNRRGRSHQREFSLCALDCTAGASQTGSGSRLSLHVHHSP